MTKNRYFIEFFGILCNTEINGLEGDYEDERFCRV
jgi:hypothetical protein